MYAWSILSSSTVSPRGSSWRRNLPLSAKGRCTTKLSKSRTKIKWLKRRTKWSRTYKIKLQGWSKERMPWSSQTRSLPPYPTVARCKLRRNRRQTWHWKDRLSTSRIVWISFSIKWIPKNLLPWRKRQGGTCRRFKTRLRKITITWIVWPNMRTRTAVSGER